jgi:multidrug efflux pump subunit AcrA (membrane-fusion protein)
MKSYIYVVGLTVALLVTGCGVPQEEHDAAVAQLQAERADVEETLNGKISDLESVVKSEKAKSKSLRLELESTERKLKTSQQKGLAATKEAATAKAKITSLNKELSRAESATSRVKDQLASAQEQASTFEAERDEVQKRLDMFMKNMNSLSDGGGQSLPDPDTSVIIDADNENSDLDFLPPSDQARILLERMRSK